MNLAKCERQFLLSWAIHRIYIYITRMLVQRADICMGHTRNSSNAFRFRARNAVNVTCLSCACTSSKLCPAHWFQKVEAPWRWNYFIKTVPAIMKKKQNTMTHTRNEKHLWSSSRKPGITHIACTQTKTDLVRTVDQWHESKPLT